MMMSESTAPNHNTDTLPQAARDALAEAQARRDAAQAASLAPEINGPKGAEPTRFGDWERKGITSDF
jgi:hypothetical protein